MEVVPINSSTLPVLSPKEFWEDNGQAVRSGRVGGDVEEERKVMERIRELGLLENKVYIERQLMTRLEMLMAQKDDMYTILNKFRRKRPLKDRLNSTISEIRKLIHPSVKRDESGQKTQYDVSVLMGFFTKNIRYQTDERNYCVVLFGETPEMVDRLFKEVTLEFPRDVDMTRVTAQYSAGVFKVSVPFRRITDNANGGDDQSLNGSTETDSFPSIDCNSVTSSDDILEEMLSPSSLDNMNESWV